MKRPVFSTILALAMISFAGWSIASKYRPREGAAPPIDAPPSQLLFFQKLFDDEECFNRLANAYIVGDKQFHLLLPERHDAEEAAILQHPAI